MRRPTGALARLTAGFDRLPIRVRLAGVSALLTFVILLAFAVAIGSLTVHRIRSDFNRQVAATAEELPQQLHIKITSNGKIETPLADFTANHGHGGILSLDGRVLQQEPSTAPTFGEPSAAPHTINGYRVISERALVRNAATGELFGSMIVEYGRRVSDTEATVKRVELFLLLGVIAGSVLALMAGIAIARRAMSPIAALTGAAAGIARTRDPSRHIPVPAADDEVSELARTLEGMLRELDAARSETETMLARQRRFVADASHELRTPLTSVLANLELLAEALKGDEGEAARSALRSSQRMRRLVADLLLLARTDAARAQPHEPYDLAQIVAEAAGELSALSREHEITLDVRPARVRGARDELHRMVVNLIENAIRHTPAGTEISIATRTLADGRVELVVADNGPGVPPAIAPTLFERFVRGAGEVSGSFGLGLAIVQAVARSHGGSVELVPSERGTRFLVCLPAIAEPQSTSAPEPALAQRSS